MVKSDEIEKSLEAQIEPWLAHMRWRADFPEWRKKRLWQENYQSEALADLTFYEAGPSPDSPLLDLGAGMGGFAVAFALSEAKEISQESRDTADSQSAARRGLKTRTIVALDYNIAYCEITRTRASRYGLTIPALVAAGENLPFASGAFGVLTCWDVVEHVQDPTKLYAEIARVLKPGGRAFVTVINRFSLVDPHYHLRFVNWMPRPLGERYIQWRQRTKESPLRDRQRLGEMHYFTFGAAVELAAQSGLDARDLNARRSRFNRASRVLGAPLYLLWRTFGMGTFRLVLTKRSTT